MLSKQVLSEDGQRLGGAMAHETVHLTEPADELPVVPQAFSVEATAAKVAADEEEAAPPSTAIVFFGEGISLQPGEKVNYFAQVMRAIDGIDRKHQREAKARKQGVKKEALEVLKRAKAKNEEEARRKAAEDGLNVPYSQRDGAVEDEEAEQLDKEIVSDTDEDVALPIDDSHLRKSLQEALEKHAEKTGDKPGDVIIVQVTDPERSVNKEEYTTDRDLPARSEKSAAEPPGRSKKIVHQKSHSHSQRSKESRLNTAEMADVVLSHDSHNMRPVVRPMNINEREPPLPATAPSLIILQHGQGRPRGQAAEDEPMTVQLPKTGAAQSAQSLKVESDDVPEGTAPMGVEIGTVAKPMNTISNTNIEMHRMHDDVGDYDHDQNTYSGKFTDPESLNAYPAEHAQRDMEGRRPTPEQLDEGLPIPSVTHAVVTGSQLSYFCPKRFNRFPRFTIFFKKGQKHEAESSYVTENTVSLNADFLKFLSDGRNVGQTVGQVSTLRGSQGHGTQTTIHPEGSLTQGRNSQLSEA